MGGSRSLDVLGDNSSSIKNAMAPLCAHKGPNSVSLFRNEKTVSPPDGEMAGSKNTPKRARQVERKVTENGVPPSGNTRAVVGQNVPGRAPGVVRSKWRE